MAYVKFAAAFGALCAVAGPAGAEDFYKDKQITMIVASGVGGGYDIYARTFGRYAGKHIPGNPTFVPRNMPGAGGLVAANTLYTQAEGDGLTIAALTNGVPMDPLFGVTAAKFDARKFSWIGSLGKLQNVCATWHESPIKTIEDARKREIVVAGAGPTSNTSVMPRIANDLLGTRFRVVIGYDPGAGLNKAMESREVEGICGLSWSTMTASRPDWIRDKKLNVLVQFGFEKLKELPDVPAALDLVTDDEKRKVLELVLIRQETGRPLVAPPGVPKERMALLRKAFDDTVKDPEFLAEAKKLNLDIDPLNAAAVEKLLEQAYGAPKPTVDAAARLVAPPKKAK